MAKKYIMIVAFLFTVVILFLLINYSFNDSRNDNTENFIENTWYSPEEKEFVKEYGSLVSSVMVSKNVEYNLVDTYTISGLESIDMENLSDEKIQFSVYENNSKELSKITANIIYNNDNTEVYCEVFFDKDSIYFYVNDNMYSSEPTYGYIDDLATYCFDIIEEEIVGYQDQILSETLNIYDCFLDVNKKSVDQISAELVDTKYSKSLNDFIPINYKIDDSFTAIGDINKDGIDDLIIVLDRNYNYIRANGYYAYPRIGIILFADEYRGYTFGGFLSNLIPPKNANEDTDNFSGFSFNGSTIIARSDFNYLDTFYIQKYAYDNNMLKLIGYTKGFRTSVFDDENYYYITEDYNLYNGDFNLDVKQKHGDDIIDSDFYTLNIGKDDIFYGQMIYNSDLEVIKSFEEKYFGELLE